MSVSEFIIALTLLLRDSDLGTIHPCKILLQHNKLWTFAAIQASFPELSVFHDCRLDFLIKFNQILLLKIQFKVGAWNLTMSLKPSVLNVVLCWYLLLSNFFQYFSLMYIFHLDYHLSSMFIYVYKIKVLRKVIFLKVVNDALYIMHLQ